MTGHPDSRCLPQLKSLWKSVFGDSDQYIDIFFSDKYRPSDSLVYTDGSKVLSMLFFPSYDIKIHSAVYEASYICGAATHPSFRGKGYMSNLLLQALDIIRQRGKKFSVLIPADSPLYKFYSKYGFRPFFKKGVSIYTPDAPNIQSGISLVNASNACTFMPLYKAITEDTSGIVLQNTATYNTILRVHSSYGGQAYIINDKNGCDIGFLFSLYENGTIYVKEIMAKEDVMAPVAGELFKLYPAGKIIFQGQAGKRIKFARIKTAGMIKELAEESRLIEVPDQYPYMNMMLD